MNFHWTFNYIFDHSFERCWSCQLRNRKLFKNIWKNIWIRKMFVFFLYASFSTFHFHSIYTALKMLFICFWIPWTAAKLSMMKMMQQILIIISILLLCVLENIKCSSSIFACEKFSIILSPRCYITRALVYNIFWQSELVDDDTTHVCCGGGVIQINPFSLIAFFESSLQPEN